MGSLDGMVITRDNELIAAPLVTDRPPLLTAASITRISEAVMRKMELRLASGLGPSQQLLVNNNTTPIDAPVGRCLSDVASPPLDQVLSLMEQQNARVSSLSRRSSTTKVSVAGSKMAVSCLSRSD